LSLPRRREASDVKGFWIPAFAGMTFLEVALRMTRESVLTFGRKVISSNEDVANIYFIQVEVE